MKEDNEIKTALFRNDYISHLFAMQITFKLPLILSRLYIYYFYTLPSTLAVSLNTKGKLKLILFETREGDNIDFMACINFSSYSKSQADNQ